MTRAISTAEPEVAAAMQAGGILRRWLPIQYGGHQGMFQFVRHDDCAP
jgi:hypothetical protein